MDEIKSAAALLGRKGGLAKSAKKAAAARDNGKKGGRHPKSDFELDVVKDGKPRKLRLVSDGGKQYRLCVVYPPDQSGQIVEASVRHQPKAGGFPDIRFYAKKNGFDVVG